MSAIQKKEITNIREAARLYNIPRTTLRDRLKGRSYRAEQRANGHKLTQNEEESLVQWIISMDRPWSSSPSSSCSRYMANILLSKRVLPISRLLVSIGPQTLSNAIMSLKPGSLDDIIISVLRKYQEVYSAEKTK